jgi:2-amino-4-hydroxy-6-hydroxymethyldihydropteridine diphosphokinase
MIYLGLGSNLGNRLQNIYRAYSLIEFYLGKIIKKSSIWESEPWGFKSSNMFYNSVCCIDNNFNSVRNILTLTLKIEKEMGRIKSCVEYEDRIIDIDIIAIDNKIVNTDDIQIPHPKMHLRRFVLLPFYEIEQNWKHPIFNKTIIELINDCPDNSKIRKLI